MGFLHVSYINNIGAVSISLSLSLTIVRMDDLKVLDGSLSNTPVEVEHVGLRLFVPHWRLIHQTHQVVSIAILITTGQGLKLLGEQGDTAVLNRFCTFLIIDI